jgi:CDP-diacylglycerol--serine O-phosphatidyltransferase
MDSLADVIVFGLAPAVIIWQVDSTLYMTRVDDNLLGLHGRVLWGMLAVYVAGAALRLARYNVETTRAPANTFYGLPSPAAAGTVAALVLLQFQLTAPSQGEWVNWTGYAITRSLPFIAIGLGVLMVSRVYYVHAGKKLLAGSSGLDFILLLMLGVLFFLYQPVLVLAVVFCGYTLWGIAGEIRMRLGAPEEVRKRRDMIAGKLTPEEKQAEDETEHAEKSRSA